MNVSKLNDALFASKMSKIQVAERCNISRTTLDNVLAGADAKISTIESLAKVLNITVGSLFDEPDYGIADGSLDVIAEYKKEIERLQTLLEAKTKSTKVVVELDVNSDEFIKMGLKDKLIQVLNK